MVMEVVGQPLEEAVEVEILLLGEMEMERDKRLAMVPELRKRANIPVFRLGL